jgi:hypothetical protein
MEQLYCEDVNGNIVNLTSMVSFKVLDLPEFVPYSAEVRAFGPTAAFWQHEESAICDEFVLHQGNRAECVQFLSDLKAYLPGRFLPIALPSTPRNQHNNEMGDSCGNCQAPWPCDCDDPILICGICGGEPGVCRCSERVPTDDLPF